MTVDKPTRLRSTSHGLGSFRCSRLSRQRAATGKRVNFPPTWPLFRVAMIDDAFLPWVLVFMGLEISSRDPDVNLFTGEEATFMGSRRNRTTLSSLLPPEQLRCVTLFLLFPCLFVAPERYKLILRVQRRSPSCKRFTGCPKVVGVNLTER